MIQRLHIIIRGAVQGVGFRPFIYRLATEIGLFGYVLNSSNGVFIEVEGDKSLLDNFLLRIEKEKPELAIINSIEYSFLDATGYTKFEIRESNQSGETTALILPDIATCKDCVREIFDPNDRRFLYPFTNCTNCGPRFSIIESLPYDRPNTSMKIFKMCEECRKEYENPLDRRFHAQPIACPACGPKLELWSNDGICLASNYEAIIESVNLLKAGKILALKGIGGFQLLCDASNSDAIKQLRYKKNRDEKPFALMFPNLKIVKEICEVSELEERLLLSPESPIVLLKRNSVLDNSNNLISSIVAPKNPYLGIMLPYSPLHHILMRKLNKPIVATSGNVSDEPICTDEFDALKRLKPITDNFLVHNRPIVRQVDDSIVRVILGREMVLRRARGYAPLPIILKGNTFAEYTKSFIAMGAHLKNTVAISKQDKIFISQHIGDLETVEAFNAFKKIITDLQNLYKLNNENIICDMHPDYLSSKYAHEFSLKPINVQHHIAHIAACRAENQLTGSALGVSWDGTGYGFDGTIWGGEFFICDSKFYKRNATFRQFRLPGGEKAIKEPRRTLLGLLFEIYGDLIFKKNNFIYNSILIKKFSETEIKLLKQAIIKNINSPLTSSVGRLFDAVSSLTDISDLTKFEGQSAMMLEFACDDLVMDAYKFGIKHEELIVIDWQPMIEQIIEDLNNGINKSSIASKFHNTLAHIILMVAKLSGEKKVVLSGGCFLNSYLLKKTVTLLNSENYLVYWHQRVPPNDGGISLGQIVFAINLNSLT